MSQEGYRKELTIFSRVRNDFERLSRLMARASQDFYSGEVKEPPAVSRIVLYIDDLDRCPEGRVIDVLRVVHLLLAFPLFVCVVAVDPRWVHSCLDKAPGVLPKEARAEHERSELNEQVGEPATPSDYLEKIFQIPLWLRPISSDRRSAVVRALLDPVGSPHAQRLESRIVSAVTETGGDGVPTPRPDDDRTHPIRELARLDDDELGYLDHLMGLLDGNPRALKRFVNTYRLVKTSLSDVELQVYRTGPDKPRYVPYRVYMAQLAVLCTQRRRALRLVQDADRTLPDTKLDVWLERFEKQDERLAKSLRDALAVGDVNLKELEFSVFASCLERTRRYSFYL
jgi:hypothetical protein